MTTWVFLRGWGREAGHWHDFPDRFGAAMPEARVIALDLPGNGAQHARASPMRIEAMVDDVRTQITLLGVSTPVHLFGLSLGGLACIDWIARHPGEVRAAVLLNTSARPFCPWHARLRPGAWVPAAKAIAMRAGEPREAAIIALTSARGDPDGAIARGWAGIARARPVSRANVLRQLLAAARYRAPTLLPRVPLLVLAGAGDRLVDPACSRRLAAAWAVGLATHPDAGHDLTLDAGDWVAEQVRGWLGSLDQADFSSSRESAAARASPR